MELTRAQAWNLSMHERLPFFLKSIVMESEDVKIQRLSFGWIEFLSNSPNHWDGEASPDELGQNLGDKDKAVPYSFVLWRNIER